MLYADHDAIFKKNRNRYGAHGRIGYKSGYGRWVNVEPNEAYYMIKKMTHEGEADPFFYLKIYTISCFVKEV